MQKSIGVHKVKQTFLDYSPLRARLGFFSSSSSPFCEKKKKTKYFVAKWFVCARLPFAHASEERQFSLHPFSMRKKNKVHTLAHQIFNGINIKVFSDLCYSVRFLLGCVDEVKIKRDNKRRKKK